jgi:hypothetical protein
MCAAARAWHNFGPTCTWNVWMGAKLVLTPTRGRGGSAARVMDMCEVRGSSLQVTFFVGKVHCQVKCVRSTVTRPSTRLSVHVVASPTHMRCSCSEGEGGSVWGARRARGGIRTFPSGENLPTECAKIMTRSRHVILSFFLDEPERRQRLDSISVP